MLYPVRGGDFMGAKENFRKNLEYYMKRAGMNQNELAAAVHKSESSVSLWLSGGSCPRMGTVQDIADALGCKTDDLFAEIVTVKILGFSDEKQTKEMNDYWFRLNSKNKKIVLDLMKVLAESQDGSND